MTEKKFEDAKVVIGTWEIYLRTYNTMTKRKGTTNSSINEKRNLTHYRIIKKKCTLFFSESNGILHRQLSNWLSWKMVSVCGRYTRIWKNELKF